MKKYIQSIQAQCYLMFQTKAFWISLGIVSIYCALTYLKLISMNIGMDISNITRSSEWFACFEYAPYADKFLYMFPIIVSMPLALHYFDEKENKSSIYSMYRTEKKVYYTGKLTACFIGGFLVQVVPLFWNILLNTLTIHNTRESYYDQRDFFIQNVFSAEEGLANAHLILPKLFVTYPILYNILFSVQIGILAGICGIVAFVTAHIVKKYKLLILLPNYVLFWLSHRYGVKLFNTDINNLIIIENNFGISDWKIFFIYAGILGISLSVFCFFIKREENSLE